jgi:hypothetical protein
MEIDLGVGLDDVGHCQFVRGVWWWVNGWGTFVKARSIKVPEARTWSSRPDSVSLLRPIRPPLIQFAVKVFGALRVIHRPDLSV